MKIAKICDNNHIGDCWPTKEVDLDKDGKMWEISKTKSAKTLLISKNMRDSWADTVGIVTADGTPMILSYKKDCDFDVDKTGLVFDKGSAMSNSMGTITGAVVLRKSIATNPPTDEAIWSRSPLGLPKYSFSAY